VDDPVEKYLPEFKGQQLALQQDKDHVLLTRPKHPITVRNLLTHTNGLSSVKSPRQRKDRDRVPLREVVENYAKLPLKFEPGSKWEYSIGIDVAGRIIEVASGMRYEEFMDQRLLKPLGMKDTTFWPSEEQVRRLAKGYEPNARKNGLTEVATIGYFTYPLTNRKRQPFPSGGLFSTATDLSIFCRMLMDGGVYEGRRYLSLKSLQQMTSTQTGDMLNKGKNEVGYGFGWQTVSKLHTTDSGLAGPFGHGGAYGTEMWIDPRRQRVTVFMVQCEGGLPGETGKNIKHAFMKAANEAFPRSTPAAVETRPIVPRERRNVVVYKEPGRYGGWQSEDGGPDSSSAPDG
jgi:CubicO group peptidase (beta-lactamase class C family)